MRSLDRPIILIVLALAACSNNDSRTASGAELPGGSRRLATATRTDTANPIPIPASAPVSALPRFAELPPLADTVAQKIVFVPRTQTLFTAAARGKRMLVDIGRVDAEVRKDPVRKQAYLLAVSRLSPLPIGTRMRLRGPWGASAATVTGFDTWNGRVVATLYVSAQVDSLVRHREPLPAAALRVDAATAAADSARVDSVARARVAAPPAATPPDTATAAACGTDSVSPLLAERALVVRDSVEQTLRALEMPQFERLLTSVKVTSTQAPGCYGTLGRLLLIVSLRAGGAEYVRERVMILSDSGAPTDLRVTDYRFKAHDAIYALDADGDGVDDLAAKGVAELAGATVILRLDAKAKRLARLTGGFAWEAR